MLEMLRGVITALQDMIFLISNALLVPVMVLLVVGVAFSLFELGRFIYEAIMRKRHPSRIDDVAWALADIGAADRAADDEHIIETLRIIRARGSSMLVHGFMDELERICTGIKDTRMLKVQVEKLIQSCEEKAAKRTEMTRILVRVGPMLGLMGTLIPMGPALIALSQGDLMRLANNLIIAFGTTVLGLFIGGIAYMMTEIRDRWYDRDLNDIAYISEILFGD